MSYHIFLRTKVRRVRRLNAHYKTRGTKKSESATNKHCVVFLLIKLSFKVLLLRGTFFFNPTFRSILVWWVDLGNAQLLVLLIFVLDFRTPLGKNRLRSCFLSAKMSFFYCIKYFLMVDCLKWCACSLSDFNWFSTCTFHFYHWFFSENRIIYFLNIRYDIFVEDAWK